MMIMLSILIMAGDDAHGDYDDDDDGDNADDDDVWLLNKLLGKKGDAHQQVRRTLLNQLGLTRLTWNKLWNTKQRGRSWEHIIE